jgi:hypothetical protein
MPDGLGEEAGNVDPSNLGATLAAEAFLGHSGLGGQAQPARERRSCRSWRRAGPAPLPSPDRRWPPPEPKRSRVSWTKRDPCIDSMTAPTSWPWHRMRLARVRRARLGERLGPRPFVRPHRARAHHCRILNRLSRGSRCRWLIGGSKPIIGSTGEGSGRARRARDSCPGACARRTASPEPRSAGRGHAARAT